MRNVKHVGNPRLTSVRTLKILLRRRLDLMSFIRRDRVCAEDLRMHNEVGAHMSCCHNYYVATEGGESVFSVDISSTTFGHGVLKEAGEHAKALGMSRVALFTDKRLGSLRHVAQGR